MVFSLILLALGRNVGPWGPFPTGGLGSGGGIERTRRHAAGQSGCGLTEGGGRGGRGGRRTRTGRTERGDGSQPEGRRLSECHQCHRRQEDPPCAIDGEAEDTFVGVNLIVAARNAPIESEISLGLTRTMSPKMEIGEEVRVNITVRVESGPPSKKRKSSSLALSRRALVAAASCDVVSVVQDDPAPIPLLDEEFLIAPHFVDAGGEVEECEVDASDIRPLLEFEAEMQHVCVEDARKMKDFGDAMMRLNDFTRAVSYYEVALHRMSSHISIGSTIILKCQGHAVLAEVDCMEDDTLDITLLSGEEKTIRRREVILGVLEEDEEMVQTKILLNLSRCLLKLASIDTTPGTVSCVNEHKLKQHNRQEYYKLASIRGCSTAITLCDHHGGSSNALAADLEAKGRLVRARAFLGLARVPNALVDAKKISALNPREAEVLLRDIRAFQTHSKAVDRRLSKAVAKLVHSATTSTEEEAMEGMNERSVSAGVAHIESQDRERFNGSEHQTGLIPFLVPVLAVILALFGLRAMNN